MQLDELNTLDAAAAARELLRCCGSSRWAARMADSRPFADAAAMTDAAARAFADLGRADWLEAFAAHPKIGESGGPALSEAPAPSHPRRVEGSREPGGLVGFESSRSSASGAFEGWAANEQALVAQSDDTTRQRLAEANRDYEARFGYIFIVCATGRSGAEMLALLERRLGNDSEAELRIAANEQTRITHLRLTKLLERRQDMNR